MWGRVRVLDFGSVKLQMETGPKLTAFGTTLGSPYYMSPEQAMGKTDVDQRTDVFAITAMLHEMLTGKVAFDGENIAAILMNIIKGSPTPTSMLNPNVPAAVDAVIEKGTAKEKSQRYASVSALADATLKALGLSGTTAEWADKSVAEIEAALAGAKPPPPPAYGAPEGDPAGYSAMSSMPGDEPPVNALPQNPMLKWVGVGCGVLFVLSLIGGGIWAALS